MGDGLATEGNFPGKICGSDAAVLRVPHRDPDVCGITRHWGLHAEHNWLVPLFLKNIVVDQDFKLPHFLGSDPIIGLNHEGCNRHFASAFAIRLSLPVETTPADLDAETPKVGCR